MNNTYGLVESVIEPDHYLLGASPLRGDKIRLDGDWRNFLPDTESQNIRGIETYNCTGYGTNNVLEILLRQRGIPANYSDRALAIAAGTSPQVGGNDPHVVAETVRKTFGAVNEATLPFNDSVQAVTDYFRPNPLTSSILHEGASWWNSWSFGHEWIIPPKSGFTLTQKQDLLLEGLMYSPLGISAYAWVQENNLYIKPADAKDNHWVTLVYGKKNEYWIIFDSYDGYLKKLAWDYDFGYSKIYYLQSAAPRSSIMEKLLAALTKLRDILLPATLTIGAQPSDERIRQWCEAIKTREGWTPGSRSYRNNNPGNLKYSPTQSGKDSGGFSVFTTYEEGFNALMHQLRIVTNGTSPAYTAAAKSKFNLASCSLLSLYQFYEIYAPAEDQNDPTSYAHFVATRLGVSPWTKVKDL